MFVTGRIKRLALFACLAVVFNGTSAISQELKVLDEQYVKGWKLSHLQTSSSGISCQALKCQTNDCSRGGQHWEVLLWGSQRRNAVSPMFSARFTARGADNAYLQVDGRRYPMERAKTNNRRLIAKDERHDQVILEALIRSHGKKIIVGADQGKEVFRLKEMEPVLAYFSRMCRIK